MNKLTADHAIDAADLLSPINQQMADVQVTEVEDFPDLLYPNLLGSYIQQSADDSEPASSLLGWLSDLTEGSYNAWLARGGTAASVE